MSRPRILMVYFSRTGNTRRLAEAIARELACDIEVIRESRNRQGFTEFVKSCFEALFRHHPKIETVQHDPSAYDLVILGTPVWAGSMSSPVRSYIASYQGVFRNVAFFAQWPTKAVGARFSKCKGLLAGPPQQPAP